MKTQREFILQVVKQTAKPENIFKIRSILDVGKQYVTTNIDFDIAKDYIPYIVEFNTDDILTETLPGTPSNNNSSGTWVYIYNQKETKDLIQKLFYARDITTENKDIDNTNNTSNSTVATSTKSNNIKVEILNGTGQSGNLQKAENQLTNKGFNVYKTGTTNITSKTTVINKKSVNDTFILDIKDILGVGIIQNSQSTSSKVDITVIIGKDYN